MCRRVRGKGSETDGVADANALEGRQVASNSNYNKGIFIGSWILSYIAINPIPVNIPLLLERVTHKRTRATCAGAVRYSWRLVVGLLAETTKCYGCRSGWITAARTHSGRIEGRRLLRASCAKASATQARARAR